MVLTLKLLLQRFDHVAELDHFERLQNIGGGDSFVLPAACDIMCTVGHSLRLISIQ